MATTKIVKATGTDKESALAKLREQGIAVQSDLIEKGEMPDKPKALGPEDFANRYMLIDSNTVTCETFQHKKAGKQLKGLRMTVTDIETGESSLFMSASESLVSWYHEQFLPMQDQLPRRLAVYVEAVPHSTDPERTVYTFR